MSVYVCMVCVYMYAYVSYAYYVWMCDCEYVRVCDSMYELCNSVDSDVMGAGGQHTQTPPVF